MQKLCGLTMVAAMSATMLIGAAGASAATEVGNNCTADASLSGGFTYVQLGQPSSSLPLTAPAAGVVTKWKLSVVTFPGSVGQSLKVFRSTGSPNQFLAVAESAIGTVVSGSNAFDTRIPVQAGDRFGVAGPEIGTLYCKSSNPADNMGKFKGAVANGSTQTFEEEAGARAAVSAIIEPDADLDGFGDETQDKCPQSAAVQTDCPVVTLDTTSIVQKGAVIISVAASSEAAVTVSASARIPSLAKSSALTKLKGPTKTVSPGKIVRFRLGFSKALRSALKALPANKTVKLKTLASAKNVAGQITNDRTNLRLKGQG